MKVLIDGNSVGFAAHQRAKLSAGNQDTQAIFGFLKTIRELVRLNGHGRVIVLWDGYSWRKRESKEYKAQRSKTAKQQETRADYKDQAQYIRAALKVLGVTQVIASNLEADDLAAIFSQRFQKNGETVRLITRDKDWLQLVTDRVSWQDHHTGDICTSANFASYAGYERSDPFVQHKALTGDVSDNIKGVGGVGDKSAQKMLDEWGSVEAFVADADREARWREVYSEKCPKACREFPTDKTRQDKFAENIRLMDLRSGLPDPENLKIDKGSFNSPVFKKLCLQLGFMSILNKFDEFISPFEEAHNTNTQGN